MNVKIMMMIAFMVPTTVLCAYMQTCQHPSQQQHDCSGKVWQATAPTKAG